MSHEHESARGLDRFGVIVSGICLLHCLTLPFLAMVIPFLGEKDEFFHWIFLFFIVPVAFLAFAIGYSRHGSGRILAMGAAGALLVVLGALLEGYLPWHGDHWVTVSGSALLIWGHLANSRSPCKICGGTDP